MLNLKSNLAHLFALGMVLCLTAIKAGAQESTCKQSEFNVIIDDTGEFLRAFSSKRRPLLHEKFEELAAKKKWPAATAIDQGYKFATNKNTAKLDMRARQLLIELDRIGERSNTAATCADLNRLKNIAFELKTVTEAKFAQMLARVNAELNAGKKVASTKPKPQVKPKAKPKAKPRAPAAKLPAWQTKTQSAPPPPAAVVTALPPPEAMPVDTVYSVREIREAGRGFFGNISAELASVIQYTFKNYGRPNGYILGTEGGGAFLAGLSFGKGRLNTKTHARRKVFWQGPSFGYDLGLQGSRVMFLVYNIKRPEQIFRRFAGIGGSAYVVGGVGLTYHKRGKVVLAPIRTGVGLRLGANIGYLKFTPKLSINPF